MPDEPSGLELLEKYAKKYKDKESGQFAQDSWT